MHKPKRQPSLRRRSTSLRFERLESRLALAGDLTTGLVHYWTFDETTGDIAHDSVGNADGTLVNWTGEQAKWEPGRIDGALQFSSAGDYVLTPFDSTPVPGSFAVSFWLNMTDRQGPNAHIIAPKGGNVIFINNESNRGVSFLSNAAVDFSNAAFDPNPPLFNGWEHYALNFNADTKQGVIYRNGAPVAIAAYNDLPHLGSWVIGHHEDLSNNNDSLHGALDDFRIYNRVLTDDDIALLAKMGTPQPTHQSPVHEWTFDETTGFTAHDTIGGANGTLINWNQTEPRWVDGKVGGALAFTTADDAIVTPAVSTSAQWSVAFWVDVTAHTGINPRVIEPWAYIRFDNNQGMGFSYANQNTFDDVQVQLNKWEHYVITFDTISAIGTIYRNGVAVKSGFLGGNSPAFPLVIGHNQDLSNPNDSLNGLLDDLRIYDRALTAGEVQRLVSGPAVVTKDDAYTALEDTLLTIPVDRGVLINDSDLDDSPQAMLAVDAVHGAVQLASDGSFTYQPAKDYHGPDSFTYKLTDNRGNTAFATVSLTVNSVNDAPTFTSGPDVEVSDELAAAAHVTNISFDDLTGAPDNQFYNYTDGDFAVTAVSGHWIEAHDPSHITGHPAPAIYGDTDSATLEIKRKSGGAFALSSFDLASWKFDFPATDSPVQYTVEGYLNGQLLYSSTGQVSTSDFTMIDELPGAFVDTLRFNMDRVDSPAYILDNIRLITSLPTATISPATMTFDGLNGFTGQGEPFLPYDEAAFRVAPSSGRWQVLATSSPSGVEGHPAPSIWEDTFTASLQVTRQDSGEFTFAGIDLFGATAAYTFTGYLNGNVVFTESGVVPQAGASSFVPIVNPSRALIDSLKIDLQRNDSEYSAVDNIRLGSASWATSISPGPADEGSQQRLFNISVDKPELFDIQPAIDPSGHLTFVPKANADGLATVSVFLHDDGGTANGGIDTSPVQTFKINVVKQHHWHNVANSTDVDGDNEISATDVITIINYINAGRPGDMSAGQIGQPYGFVDVDADNSVTASDVIAVINVINAAPPKPAAAFVTTDTTTQGNWIGTYGSGGYALNSGPTSLPDYAQMSFKSGLTEIYDYVTAESTDDVQALQKPGAADRLFATWTGDYGFVLDLNLRSSQPHRVALYMYPGSSRSQRLEVINAETGEVLDTQTLENFADGRYLVWNIAGHVKIRFINIANGLNAVLNGVFFD